MRNLARTIRGSLRQSWQRVHLEVTLRDVERQSPILVYQMGKVGSSTVVSTLEMLRLPNPVLHIHTLVPERLKTAIGRQRASSRPHLDEHLLVSSILLSRLEKGRFPCRVITLTREPISRAISFVFEDWRKKTPDARLAEDRLDESAMKGAVDLLLSTGEDHADPGRWFDKELKASLGLDVFSVPYDESRGYAILHDQDVSLLILRMEDLNRALPDALAAFLGLDAQSIALSRANEADGKWYSESMSHVKKAYRLPQGLLDQILSTRYMQHFYPHEINRLRERWGE